MPNLLITISSIIGLLYTANLINRFSLGIYHWLKFKSFPMSEVEIELQHEKENHRRLEKEYKTLKEENDKLTLRIINLIPKE